MKYTNKLLALLLALCMLAATLISCDDTGDEKENSGGEQTGEGGSGEGGSGEFVDYVSDLKLDMNSTSLKVEVERIKMYIDGDTTHFYLKENVGNSNVVKARYLAVDTPESTGKIEEWGKKAKSFTNDTLANAVSIILESDTDEWNMDSNGRHLLWVWYKPAADADYRCLNLELLQNGLAIASNSAMNRYGNTCMAAIAQARENKLYVHSDELDPDYPYGQATELTLKELRTNVESYDGYKVAFTGIITYHYNDGFYIESYDEITELYYGMYVYYGHGFSGQGIELLAVGNEVRIVGVVGPFSGSYQVSGLTYDVMNPNNPDNITVYSEWNDPAYVDLDAREFKHGVVSIPVGEEDEPRDFTIPQLTLATSVKMNGLYVKSVSTTDNEESSSNGAMTLTCEIDGEIIKVRTLVLSDSLGNVITADAFEGKTVNVRGVVDYFDYDSLDDEPGEYQIKVLTLGDITVVN